MRRATHVINVAMAILRRPPLWRAALGVVVRLIPNGWTRRGPLPPRAYLKYRGQSVYGMPLSDVPAVDVIRYLEWCKAFPGPIR